MRKKFSMLVLLLSDGVKIEGRPVQAFQDTLAFLVSDDPYCGK